MRRIRAFTYSPYGQSATLISERPSLGFNGEFFDAVTTTYPLGNGHRLYSPKLMRFLSPDELSPFSEGGINTYMYCNGDPIGKIDPSGRNSILIIIKPLNSLYKGIKNRFFGRTPKSKRPPQTPGGTPTKSKNIQDGNSNNNPYIRAYEQQQASSDRWWLYNEHLSDIEKAKNTDLTKVPRDVLDRAINNFNHRQAEIDRLTREHNLPPFRRHAPHSSPDLSSNAVAPIRSRL
ncbi:hypothetical protein GVN15_13430 [Pseudomonas putida]|uniref:RHS repeat-associated core domain-containing protein n=1 Tax=Pseudomonas TaxID=286 RepID=UPI0013790A00|nr:hypothetical protein [Pseudomonas putida]